MRETAIYFYFQCKIWRHHRIPRPRFPVARKKFGDSLTCNAFIKLLLIFACNLRTSSLLKRQNGGRGGKMFTQTNSFYPRDSTLARILAVIGWVSVCVCRCVCLTHAGIVSKKAKHRITQTTARDSPRSLVFWRQESLWTTPSFPLKFVLNMTISLSKTAISTNIRSQRLSRESWWKISVSTSRKSTTRFSKSHINVEKVCYKVSL